MLTLKESNSPSFEVVDNTDCGYLSTDFYTQLNNLKKTILIQMGKGLTPPEYQKQNKILDCYSAAQIAITKINNLKGN